MSQNNQYIVLFVILGFVFMFFYGFYVAFIQDDIVDKIRRGNVILSCIMSDGERIIEGEKVVDFIDGTFYFINGQASNCREVK